MREQSMGPPGRPVLPPEAEAEIVEILRRHKVSGDAAALQDGYRKRLGQRLMASLRDEDGRREVLSTTGGDYVVVEYCNDQQKLKSIRRRVQGQMSGLDVSASKVQGRIRVLDQFIARFQRKRGDENE